MHKSCLWLTALGASITLAGCGLQPPTIPPTMAEAEASTPLANVPTRRAWVNGGDARLVLQRGLVNGSEQKISLPNRTGVPGDNLLHVRSWQTFGLAPRFRYEEFMKRIGGRPAPFQDLRSGELTASEDEAGTYLWAERRVGANTICVFAVRRLDSRNHQMPRNTDMMDVMLRNCVVGTRDDALRPIQASSLGSVSSSTGRPVANRMLSPLAAPTPR